MWWTIIGIAGLVVNLAAIGATLSIKDFPAPGGKVVNVAIHAAGAWCGWLMIGYA